MNIIASHLGLSCIAPSDPSLLSLLGPSLPILGLFSISHDFKPHVRMSSVVWARERLIPEEQTQEGDLQVPY